MEPEPAGEALLTGTSTVTSTADDDAHTTVKPQSFALHHLDGMSNTTVSIL